MANVNNSLLNQGINEVKRLIEDFKVSIDRKEKIDKGEITCTMSRAEFGSLTFSRKDDEKMNQALSTLHNAVKGKKSEKWSQEGIARFLHDAIFQSLHIPENSDQQFEQHLETAVGKLKTSLSEQLKVWEFYHVVLGLDVGETRRKIGNVEFFHVNEKKLQQILRRVNDITDNSANTPEEKESFKGICEQQIYSFFNDASVAALSVSAGDLEAARKLALEELQITLDVINFYALSIHSENLKVRVFLPGDAVRTQSLNIAFMGDEKFKLGNAKHGPLVNLSLSLLDEKRSEELGLTRLSEILINAQPNEIEIRLLAAVRIAGKAVSSIRREDSFLLHAIALESILVGGDEKTDLRYKLSTRCAHLLGEDLERRKTIKKEMDHLYDVRSAIVHKGENNFTDADFFKIRRCTQNVLVALLTREEFKNFSKKEELNQWFDERMLS